MVHFLGFIFTFLFIFSFHIENCESAIFGFDNRVLVRPSSTHYRLGQSTAVGVLSSLIEKEEPNLSTYKIHTDSLSDFMCKSEKFSTQPSLAYACSGFLIAPDLLVTAGHCMVNTGVSENESGLYCEAYSWLFGYAVGANGKVRLENIPENDYYKCKKIIYAIIEDVPPYRDYALVQLDRNVVGRTPLEMSIESVKENQPVYMLGYPMGIPLTYSGNAKVLIHEELDESFFTDLDAFDGNSGSAVFNRQNKVVGILVGGTPMSSFVAKNKSSSNSCYIYNKCDLKGKNCTEDDVLDSVIFQKTNRAASEVQKLQPILELLEKIKFEQDSLFI